MASVPLLTPDTEDLCDEEMRNPASASSGRNDARRRWIRLRVMEKFSANGFASSAGLRRTVAAVTPSFVHGLLLSKRADQPAGAVIPERVHETAYLDGLRGLAAIVVYISHLAGFVTETMFYGYGFSIDPKSPLYNANNVNSNRHFIQLPMIRFFYNASMMVSLFFVISGFALSINPIKHMRSADENKVLRSLSSSIFRRPLRLYLPTFVATLIPLIMLELGFFEMTRKIHAEGRLLHASGFNAPPRRRGFWADFIHFWYGCWRLVSVCRTVTPHPLNGPTWTIPFEFEGSLFLYMTQLGLSRVTPALRLAAVASLVVLAMFSNLWTMMLFWAGLGLAEFNTIIAEAAATHKQTLCSSKPWKIFFWLLLLVGIYLGSYPFNAGDLTPGYIWLSRAMPANFTFKNHFSEGLGAILVITAVSRLPLLKACLSTPAVRYLGHISFGLYLTHLPLVQTLGVRILAAVYTVFDINSDVSFFVGFVLAFALTSIPVFWVADLFTRHVDVPCTTLGKRLEAFISKTV